MTLHAKTFFKSVLAGTGGAAFVVLLACSAQAQPAPASLGLPFYFEANKGQVSSTASFLSRGRDFQFWVSSGEAQITLARQRNAGDSASKTVRMQFVGADGGASISGEQPLPGKINYLIGGDTTKWQTDVSTFAQLRESRLYPGVDLIYHGNPGRLEYDFTIAPGTDPKVIAIRFTGADNILVNSSGELVLNLGDGEIRQPKPFIYQIVHGARQMIRGGYKILNENTVAFSIGDYDSSLPLVIDPILSCSTYFGGSANDAAYKVAVDTNGYVYIAGQTLSTKLATIGSFQTNFAGGTLDGDAFVAKFNPDGSNLVYCTYLGGNQEDLAYGLAVDNIGDVFLTGTTVSPNFPTNNALYPTILGHAYFNSRTGKTFYTANVFVAEIDPTGSHLIFSTYLGGSGNVAQGTGDAGSGIAVDSAGNAYVTGFTSSTNFPATNSLIYQLSGTNNTFNHLGGVYNAFLAKLGPGGTNLIYSTYFGGTNVDEAISLAVDDTGSAYLAGFTDSTNFPTTTSAFQPRYGGSTNYATTRNNAFVAKFDPSGTNLIYSTFLGGTNNDQAFGIAVDAGGYAYVTGSATSANFPNTVTNIPGFRNTLTNNQIFIVTTNAFLTKLNPDGAGLAYSAVFGSTNRSVNIGYGVALDTNDDAFVVGATTSAGFPTTFTNNAHGQLAGANDGDSDAFIIAFNPDASALLFSGLLGGAGNDFGYGIAVDPTGNAYIVGQTFSSNFPTNSARQATLSGTSDAFLAKVMALLDPPLLNMSLDGGLPKISWDSGLPFTPELARVFKLESSTNLGSTNWTLESQTPVLSNNLNIVTINPTNAARFFRLHAVQP